MKAIPVEKAKNVLPSVQRAAKGLSLKKVMKSTPPYYRQHARNIVIKKLNALAVTKGGLAAVTAVCVDGTKKLPTPHKCSIIDLDRPESKTHRTKIKVSEAKRVLVSCDCEDFCYTDEYALWTWGAAKIKYCNGEPAVMKNPGNIPMLCKHLYAVGKALIEHGH
jgi:hypothetical protein